MDLHLILNVPTPKQVKKPISHNDSLCIQTLHNYASFTVAQIIL